MIYLDNCATTLIKPTTVADAMVYALKNYGNPSRGGYPASVNALKAVYEAREIVASFFGLKNSSLVAFTSNITEALNICAWQLINKNDTIITTIFEHNSVLRPLYKSGASIKIIGLDANGIFDYKKLEKELEKGAKAFFCTHASNLTGELIDIVIAGRLCKKYNAYFVLDTAQTAGVFKIDMEKSNIDFLCFTGHKSLLGPQGVGGICIKDGVKVKPIKVGGSGINSFEPSHPKNMPEALEAGTLNTPAICGLKASIDYINTITIDKIREHEISLMERLYDGIAGLKNIRLYGKYNKPKAPVVTFNISDIDSGYVAEELWEQGEIAVRSGAHCSPLYHKYLQTDKQGAVRVSISYFNTAHEIDKVIEIIKNISEKA